MGAVTLIYEHFKDSFLPFSVLSRFQADIRFHHTRIQNHEKSEERFSGNAGSDESAH